MAQVNVSAVGRAAQETALARACDTLDGRGLKLAIEYMPITPLATLADTLALIAGVGNDRAGALVDIWHHSHDPAGWETLAAAPLDAIAYVEFCDAAPRESDDLTHEMLHRRRMPGDGVLDCARFAGLLARRGYAGMVSAEVLDEAWRARPAAQFAQACHDASRRYFPAG